MIKLKDFLKVANEPVVIREGVINALTINDCFFDSDLLSEKLLNSEVERVESDNKQIIVIFKEDLR